MAEGTNNVNSWTAEQLKEFLHDRNISLAGNKAELVRKVSDIIATDDLERDLEALPFQTVDYPMPPSFNDLSAATDWATEGFPVILEMQVTAYLKAKGGYTKNFRTGVRLYQCSHLYDVEMATVHTDTSVVYVKAKCSPTMHKNPVFYALFVVFKQWNS